MARLARVVVVDTPHHITQLGNARRNIFFSDENRRVYLDLLRDEACCADLAIIGYCLMTNHVHIIAVPRRADSMATAFRHSQARYAHYLNSLQHKTGHVWQGRYYSCPLDEAHLWRALRYIELNPVGVGLVPAPEAWPWSSAEAHTRGRDPHRLLDLHLWRGRWSPEHWRQFLRAGTTRAEADTICRNTHTGRPLGSTSFVRDLEQRLNRPLARRPGGRPTKYLGEGQSDLWQHY